MTIDERFTKIEEKHLALAETVEIVAGMQRANEATLADLLIATRENTQNIARLARIAEAHERRITGLE